ncbi:E3 ubiquitin-protein ligase synoviolin/Hrd1 [Chloropicon primus]|uniref:RING-type E3 ubiquitin transferase n=2 Tax=Chloropicon primus TaxID=1764295 RepID=A0A5B8MFF1_9CHLO|nr:E3 ubiquitin-protein ligase synoviolin/Hrd1 [Chloropicon primus]UPQ98412.1 E3 ubiquitin-protein ligase synoviolin/Hrd1 [Chloropicon primus]|eukprot:QDZ19203.1 E3 ubiquitin-protein ligase synoviolin/Hrd1 [Chloropicon primus]
MVLTLTKYAAASVTVAAAAILHAWTIKQQLYPTMVLLTTSKILLVVLGNLALSFMLCLGKAIKATFLGQLRESEVERLQDRMKETIMEMCIAMTIFREEFSFSFIRYFSFLLFLKVFHWLSSDRVEFLETSPNITASQHFRCSSLIAGLLLVDILFLREAIIDMTSQGPSVLLLFAFEYIILATGCIKLSVKYLFYWVDKFYQGNWTGKSICALYLDLVTELFQLAVYSIFFCIIFVYYGLPFHLLRDLYWSMKNFKNKLVAFIKYRRITTNMNENFEDATAEEIGENSVCIICREEMVAGAAKKLHCGHIFHANCLRSWLERQQTCPMCRTPVIPVRVPQAPPVAQPEQPQQPEAPQAPREPPLQQQQQQQPREEVPQQPQARPAAHPGAPPGSQRRDAPPQQQQQQQQGIPPSATQQGGMGRDTDSSPGNLGNAGFGGFNPMAGGFNSMAGGFSPMAGGFNMDMGGQGMGPHSPPLWYQNPYGVVPLMPAPFPPPMPAFQMPSPEQHAMAMAAAQAAVRAQQGTEVQQQQQLAAMQEQLQQLQEQLKNMGSPSHPQEPPPRPQEDPLQDSPRQEEGGPSTSDANPAPADSERRNENDAEDDQIDPEDDEIAGDEEPLLPQTETETEESSPPSTPRIGIVGDSGSEEVNELRQRRLNRFSP